jgi:hypothetical protein
MSDTDGRAKEAPAAGAHERRCQSCTGTGEIGTEAGPKDCPDCGGSGALPRPDVLIEWRMRDIERARAGGDDPVASDVRWLLAELRRARTALTEIVSLAEDAGDDDIARRLRLTAGRALGLVAARPDASR